MGCFIVFISMFYLIGFIMLGYGVWSARQSTQAATWPTTPGAITELSIQEKTDSEGDATYEVKVQYKYTVEGAAYEGARLAFGYSRSSEREAHDEIHTKLKAAKGIIVRYDPSDPSVSCLSFGLHRSIKSILTFAVFWLAFIIGLTVFVWLSSRSDTVLLDNLSVL